MKTALIDGDAIIYILAWKFKDQEANEETLPQMKDAVDQSVISILVTAECSRYIGALSAGVPCFRHEVAKYKPYKGTRREDDPWVTEWKPAIRWRLFNQWEFTQHAGYEADDIIAIAAHQLPIDQRVICSPDKDLRQIPGTHLDYRKMEFADITPEQAEYILYYQMLVGDDVDNVAGLPGCGPKKAAEKLKVATDTHTFVEQVVRNEYNKYFGNHYGGIIFEENKIVLQLVNPTHPYYDQSVADFIEKQVQCYHHQLSSDVFENN